MKPLRSDLRLGLPLVMLGLLLAAGCGKSDPDDRPTTLSEAERDSVVATSKLPGSGVMGKTLAVSDSAEARARRLNELSGP